MDAQNCDQLAQLQLNEDPTEFDASNFQNMTENCQLVKVLDNSLELMDLCFIAETCKHLIGMVQRAIVPKFFCSMKTGSLYDITIGEYNHRTDKEGDIERVFKIFGPCLTAVSVCDTSLLLCDDIVLDFVQRYCGDELKSLHVENVRIAEDVAKNLEPVFKGLETLQFFHVCIEGDQSLFVGLDSLIELELKFVVNGEAILLNTFPKLERLTYSQAGMTDPIQNANTKLSLETICSSVSCYTGLKKLDVTVKVSGQRSWMTVLHTITKCTELEELRITNVGGRRFASELFQPLQRLQSLRVLELGHVSFDNFEVFASMAKLSELVLYRCRVPSNFHDFERLARLTKLRLRHCEPFTVNHVVEIVRRLVLLEELEVFDHRTMIDVQTYGEIMAIANEREKALMLNCIFNFDKKKYNNGTQRVTNKSPLDGEVF